MPPAAARGISIIFMIVKKFYFTHPMTTAVQRSAEGRMNWVRMALTTYRPASAQAMPV